MKRNYFIVFLILLSFFVISFITNVFGPLLPDMINGFRLSLTLAALLPFAFFLAYGVMSIPAGMLVEKYKEKKIMGVGFAVAFAGSLLLAFFPNYLTAILSLFIIGCGMAILQVVINPLLRTSGGEEHYAFNSVLAQLIFGLASFLSPLVYSGMMKQYKATGSNTVKSLLSRVPASLPWISLYWLFFLICLGMVLLIAFTRFPEVERKEDEVVGAWKTHLMLFRQPVVILYFLALFTYVGTEQGVANWMSQFLATYHGYAPATDGASAVAYFWGLMTAGGVLGLFLLKVMDSRRVLIVFTIPAMIALTVGLFGPGPAALIAFPLVGFFASVMYPIIFSLALNSVSEHHGSFSGILVTGIVGGAVVPLIIGWIGDRIGLRAGMCVIYFTMGYILSIGFWAKPIIINKTISLGSKTKEA